MDVLFVNTIEFNSVNVAPPLGLYSLAGVLQRETELEVSVINFDYLVQAKKFNYENDMDTNIENMAQYLLNQQAKVVDFYTMCNSFAITLCVAERLKQLNEDIIITFGGPQASLCAADILNNFPFVELVGIGEGELYISDLMKALVSKSGYSHIEGLAFREGNLVKESKCHNMIPSDELGKYTVFEYDLDALNLSKVKYFPIEAGRGCPFGCTFCSTSMFWGRKFRVKPVSVLVEEMKKYNELYGFSSFSLEHDMFTVNKAHLMEFCKAMIDSRLGFTWGCSSRIDALDDEMMQMMKKAGCQSIYMGIETGSQSFQRVVNKNLKLDEAVDKIVKLKDYGFDLTVSFIYGFPEETEKDFRETMNMIQRLLIKDVLNVQLHLFIPLPNTKETAKVNDRLYFDSSQIELSVYNANKFNDRLNEMILKYKEIFVQYYTFDSDLRKNYTRIDFLLEAFVAGKGMYKFSVNYLLKKCNLVDIYKKYEQLIKNTEYEVNHLSVNESFGGLATRTIIYKMVHEILIKEFADTSEEIMEMIKFEQEIADYNLNKANNSDNIIIFHKFDFIEALKTGCFTRKDSYYVLSKTPTGLSIKAIDFDGDLGVRVAT